ncbi:hypothetical protein [Acidovorax sp. sic0104]|uniref:hypothetical protein n=1 Tax=Acidovorax sp. sic0104 TaxID=2854784 RepID=UPI001C46E0BC|nr:hypothetical protein [Acidovorax sp. sic0104]MBV7542003.1 hypothetical protein [Acidovorax sp. sic0104]
MNTTSASTAKQSALEAYRRDVVLLPLPWLALNLLLGALVAVGIRWLAWVSVEGSSAARPIDYVAAIRPMFEAEEMLRGFGGGAVLIALVYVLTRVLFRKRSADHRGALFLVGLMAMVVGGGFAFLPSAYFGPWAVA